MRITATPKLPAGSWLLLSDVDWRMYTRLLASFAQRPGIRLTYDRGELEIMAPLLNHDDDGRFLGNLVNIVTEELELPLHRGGSATMRRHKRLKGIEADECFWIANAPRMQGRLRLDLRRDPPPDLAIEVDVSRSSLDRMAIYAAIRVPEVWRLDGNVLTFHVLDKNGKYQQVDASLSMPLLTPAKVLEFLLRNRAARDQNVVTRQIRKWVRQMMRR